MKWQTTYQGKPLLLNSRGLLFSSGVMPGGVMPEPVLGITPPNVRKELQHWACREQWRQWRDATKFRQAKQLLRQVDLSFTKYALRLSGADLRILTDLLTGHADLNRHLTLMQIRTDARLSVPQQRYFYRYNN